MEQNELPLGLGMALAQYPDALSVYAYLPEAKKTEIRRKAQSVSSKDEMQALVRGLTASD